VGDIHGCANELRSLLNQLPRDPDTTFVFVGDYVDRGPSSREVIDTILELATRCTVIPLMGNHEEMFLSFLQDPESADAALFILNGGGATLASYGIGDSADYRVPDSHIEFLRSLRVMHQTDQNVFVHAGLPQIPLIDIDPDDDQHHATMLWTRGRFLKTTYDWGKVIVHGHTPVKRVTQWPNRINIDTGCVFNGRLTALSLPGEQRFSVRRMTEGPRIMLRGQGSRATQRFAGAAPVRVKRGDRIHDLVTVDYSELGMYLRALDPNAPRFNVAERIDGIVGPDDPSPVEFTGVIVRMRVNEHGVHYGIRIIDTRAAKPAESVLAEDDSGLDIDSIVIAPKLRDG
jgi:serine/threonine protein phosphatase 1